MTRFPSLCLVSALAAALAVPAAAEPVARPSPTAGEVIATRVGEEIDLIEAPVPRGLEVLQDVKAGDVLRTNPLGQVAVLFADGTQLRLGRNSTLVVQEIAEGRGTRLELLSGRLFGRAARGGTDVFVETPAATAAIRGTDWSMSVEGGRTSLAVLEGAVDLRNPQGAVTVLEGEAAVATLGEAPSKVVLIDTDLREQMLVNLSLRGAFEAFSPEALSGPALRAEAARIAAIPPERRAAEERVVAAEIALSQEGRSAALATVAAARAVPLSAEQAARLTLVEAIVAGSEARYAEAARLFERARPGLRGERATAALYQGYFARSLADPTRALPPPAPDGGDRISVVGQAIIAAFLEGPRAAYAALARAAPRFAGDPVYLATLAEAAILAGELDTARAAAARAYALDPTDPEVLSVRASIRASLDRDLDGALADLERAIGLTPASSDLWNDLGLLQSERGALREAERAFRRAVALDPLDPVARANYAVLLLDQNRIRAAEAQIEAALRADPAFELGYFARGRRQLQSGDTAGAIESLLRATTANPAFSNGLLVLGAAYAAEGETELAEQALENADRLDPNDPVVAQYRAALAIDERRADDAIRLAQEAVRRTRARGGDFASIASTRAFGSTLGSAYRLLSLDAWGAYWGDVVFDPFDAGGYFDRALTGGPAPVLSAPVRELPGPDPVAGERSFSQLVQGLLLDPLALVGPNLRPTFVRAPFAEFELGGGPLTAGGEDGRVVTATAQALGTAPLPYALLVSASREDVELSFADQDAESLTGVLGFGIEPTPYDRVVGFVSAADQAGGQAFETRPETRPNRGDGQAVTAVLGWSHTFGHRNVLNVAAFSSTVDQRLSFAGVDPLIGLYPSTLAVGGEERTVKLGVSHLLGVGPVTLRTGAEAGTIRESSDLTLAIDYPPVLGGPVSGPVGESDSDRRVARAWVDALVEIGDDLRLEAGLQATDVEDAEDERTLAPRLGLAWAPAEGHWLRAALIRERPALESGTLAPVDVLGLDPVSLPLDEGEAETAIASWDAEWSPRVFTRVEAQHQEADDFSVSVAGSPDPVGVSDASLDRLAFSANLWLGRGVGAFGTVARTWSDATLAGGDGAIPFVAEGAARFGLTYVSPARLQLTLAETYVGERETTVPDVTLEDAWTTDLVGSWESPDRHWSIEVGIFNLFEEEYEVASGIPGVGRTATALLTARF